MKLKVIYNWLAPGIIPFLLAIILLTLIILDEKFHLFSIEVITHSFRIQVEKHGLVILIIAAFFEALFLFSFYLPGSFVIVFSVINSDKSLDSLFLIGLFSLIGFTLANILNYYLGKFGYYKVLLFLGKKDTVEKMKGWFVLNNFKTIFFSSFHPNFLSFAIVSAGIARASITKVIAYSIVSLSFWITIWIVIATPFLKKIDIEDPRNSWLILYFLFALGMFYVLSAAYKRLKAKDQ